ncbi:uncharacterized protein LOC107370543 [Tetranychus urticae]|uniref:uncharacterized protein LOC107370543 n=1 Tax=Tetranychus urticae TaxID=32264 RepID=UPI00077BA628|nr:uncharacterized protein LOC107370543 [Tetranychus urticae]
MEITKVHRVIEFYQSAWLAEYVQFCTSKRQAATSDFEKDFYKLLVNSIYGKTIEDVRKHRTVEIALQDIEAQRHLRKDQCQRFMILDENKMIFWMRKLSVMMNKPISIGFTVLELAKLKMFEIHYDTFKQHYRDNINMIYTDTDSLIYAIKTQDIVSDLRYFSSIMDFSNYPKEHPLYSNVNNKKIGYLKDELAGKQIGEFVGIRPKLYAVKTEDEVKKRAKGVPRSILKNKITFEDYLTCLHDHRITSDTAITLQSDHHNIQMIQRTKVMLSPFDDKRYWTDKLTSYAYGHYKIDQ